MLRLGLSFLIAILALNFTITSPAQAAQSQSAVEVVYGSHALALELTRKLKSPPPQMAFILGLANHAATVSAKNSNHPSLAYFAAFIEVYSLAYPQERAWLQSKLKPQGSEILVVRAAQNRAQGVWKSIEVLYQKASQPMQPPWPTQGHRPGGWRPTLPQHAQPLYPNWHLLPLYSGYNPAVLVQSLQPTPFNTPIYQQELKEVLALGSKNSQVRTPEQTQIAIFWAAGAGTVTPPGMWVEIAIQALQSSKADFHRASLTMKVLAQALSDAGVAAWSSKYQHSTCRPITAIEDLLGDKSWQPLLATPPFPSWVSGHSTFSSAAAVVVDNLILRGQRRLAVQSEAVPGQVRQFNSAWAAALEAGQSRIYGGIHFQDDNIDGLKLGRALGCKLLQNVGVACR